jgi:hypothetical protein
MIIIIGDFRVLSAKNRVLKNKNNVIIRSSKYFEQKTPLSQICVGEKKIIIYNKHIYNVMMITYNINI